MMGITQPDVLFSEQTQSGQPERVESAVPLFIGYTLTGSPWTLTAVNSLSDFEAAFGGPYSGGPVLYYTVAHYFDNGGRGGFVLSLGNWSSEITAADLLSALGDSQIIEAVAAEQQLTLVAAPDMVLLPNSDSNSWAQAWLTLLAICRARNGIFGLFDAPDDADSASAALLAFSASSPSGAEYGAAYWPRLVTSYQDANGQAVVVPPSGAVAAVVESTDERTGVWKAPANVALAQTVKPTQPWQRSEGLFQTDAASFNLIRSFAGRGTRVWGCRTLVSDTASPWLYVPARRLMSYAETQLGQIGLRFVFESNDALTWVKVRGLMYLWLRELWMAGGLVGEEESEAFEIQIGLNETMTEDDIQQGKMIVKIRLAIASPAEFITISLTFNNRISDGAALSIEERILV